jgi:rhomboid protease GluP
LFSHRARATQILIALNLFMFVVEECQGGGTNLEVLYRLGALFPPAVQAGEWWRLVSSLFLHFGVLHLAMNMFALWFLGPFVEFALGLGRFTLVYLLAGIGSMAMVMALSSAADFESLTVGASGCIMGLVGATGALMLRGWLRERAVAARRRLALMVFIVAMEIVFDSVVPQVSMTAHLSGAIIGFVATLLLQDRLSAPAPQPSVAKS